MIVTDSDVQVYHVLLNFLCISSHHSALHIYHRHNCPCDLPAPVLPASHNRAISVIRTIPATLVCFRFNMRQLWCVFAVMIMAMQTVPGIGQWFSTRLWYLAYVCNRDISLAPSNRSISQIPHCITQVSQNAPFCYRNVHTCAHFCYKMVHCGI